MRQFYNLSFQTFHLVDFGQVVSGITKVKRPLMHSRTKGLHSIIHAIRHLSMVVYVKLSSPRNRHRNEGKAPSFPSQHSSRCSHSVDNQTIIFCSYDIISFGYGNKQCDDSIGSYFGSNSHFLASVLDLSLTFNVKYLLFTLYLSSFRQHFLPHELVLYVTVWCIILSHHNEESQSYIFHHLKTLVWKKTSRLLLYAPPTNWDIPELHHMNFGIWWNQMMGKVCILVHAIHRNKLGNRQRVILTMR